MIKSLHGILQQISGGVTPTPGSFAIIIEATSSSEGVWKYDFDTDTFTLLSSEVFSFSGAGPLELQISQDVPYFMVATVNSSSSASPEVMYSKDGGNTWEYFNSAVGAYWFGGAVAGNGLVATGMRSNPTSRWAWTYDGGSTWAEYVPPSLAGVTRLQWMNHDGTLLAFPTSGNTVALVNPSARTLYAQPSTPSIDARYFWAKPDTVYTLSNPNRIFLCPAVSGTAIYYSDDMGQNWSSYTVDSGYTFTYSKMCGSDDGSKLYVMLDNGAANTGRLYKSTDNGQTWSNITPAGHTGRFAVYQGNGCDPTGVNLFFGQQGLNTYWQSTDGGNTWTLKTNTGGTFANAFAVQNVNPNLIAYEPFTGADGTIVSTLYGGTMAGATWAKSIWDYNNKNPNVELKRTSNQGWFDWLQGADGIAFWTVETNESDAEIRLNSTNSTSLNGIGVGIVFRYSDIDNYMVIQLNRSVSGIQNFYVQRKVSGVITTLLSQSASSMVGALKVKLSGFSCEAYLNNSLLYTWTETTLQSNTKHGVYVAWGNNNGSIEQFRVDNFTVLKTQLPDDYLLYLDAGNSSSYPGTGTTWFDLSENNLDATLVNGVGYDSGDGGGLVFDGVDDYGDLGTISELTGIYDLTVCAWVKPISNSGNGAIVNRYFNTSSNNGWFLANSSGAEPFNFNFGGRESSSVTANVATTDKFNYGDWHHVVGVKSGNKWSIYVDGVLENSITAGSGTVAFLNNVTYLGAYPMFPEPPNRNNNINIAQVQIYRRALSQVDITSLFDSTKSRYGL